MACPSKAKGNRAERKIVEYFRQNGLIAERAYASNGRALGEHEEVDVRVSGHKLQVKARKKLPAIISEALTEHVDAVVLVEDRKPPVVILRIEDYLNFIKP
jgi:Holliday junction resolvase